MTQTEVERRLEQHENMLGNFANEQHQTNLVLADIKNSINQIMLYVKGEPAAGVVGLVNSMATFKRDFMSDYIKEQSLYDEKLLSQNKRIEWLEGRVKVLENNDVTDAKKYGWKAGVVGVICLAAGSAIGYFISIYF